jgi:hypothetical protein
MPLQATSGAASYDAFGGGVAVVPNYIEEVFSCFLYTGNGSTGQSIVNNIDLSGKGGLVWCKSRSSSISHGLSDTVTGRTKALRTNNFANQVTTNDSITSFNSNGFSLGTDLDTGWFNTNLANYVSWTFREQPKFFDIVTWTGNASNRTIAHSLGSVPGCIIVKRRDDDANWQVYHRSLANTEYLVLNTTDAKATGTTRWNSTTATDTVFSIGTDATVNASGGTYIAYLFAHNAGGFGLTGTDNVISCGSFTADGAGSATVNLGYEPQWLLLRTADQGDNWRIYDTMREWTADGNLKRLFPNLSNAEQTTSESKLTATGFFGVGQYNADKTYIYIAIRRGPMKVPTSGTSVYQGVARTGTSANATVTGAGFAPDLTVIAGQSNSSGKTWTDKLRGPNKALLSAYTNTEQTTTDWVTGFTNTGFTLGADAAGADYVNKSPKTYINWMFGRAPSVFDEVCYTGNGAGNNARTHNLGVAPELLIIKNRSSSASGDWYTFHTFTSSNFKKQLLDTTDAQTNYTYGSFLDAQPTSTTFTVNSGAGCNESGVTYVSYLFATCAGVSKVGSYTGTGTTKQIDCGFTGGARFVLIKRTDSTGDWYVWDSARGIVSGNDPYLLLNTTDPEDTSTDYIDTYSAGFEISSTAPAAINSNGGSFIFLAIA